MDDVRTAQARGFIEGTGHPNTTTNPALTPVSVIYYDNTPVTGGFYQLVLVSGVKTWVPLGPPAAGATWSNYVVSADPDIPAPYTTIGTAYAAAKAAVPPHSAANPATILVHPDTYAENLLLDTPGIAIMGLVSGYTGVGIIGLVTITAVGIVSLANLAVVGGVLTTGVGPSLFLDQVAVIQSGPTPAAIEWTATGGSLNAANSIALASVVLALDASSATTLAVDARDTTFQSSLSLMSMRLPDAPPSGQRLTSCEIGGTVEITAGASAVNTRIFRSCLLSTVGTTNPAIRTVGVGAQATFLGGSVACEHTDAAVGGSGLETGEFRFVGTAFPGIRGASSEIGITLAATQAVYQRPWNVTLDITGVIPVEARGVRTAALDPVTVLTLPDLLKFPDGEVIEVKRTAANANVVAVTAIGLQFVDGLASVTITDLTASGCVTVRADRANGTWRVVAVVGTFTSP